MDAKSITIRHWEDVVFENRNKAYGAYLLRRAYAQRLMTGLITTMMVMMMVLSFQRGREESGISERSVPPLIGQHDPLPPPLIRREPRQNRTAQRGKKTRSRQIVVTRDRVDENEIQAITDFVSAPSEADGWELDPIENTGAIPIDAPGPAPLPEVVDVAEIMPAYDGGMEAMMKFIQKKIRYPRAPMRLGIQGTVYVRFVVKGDGTVTDVEVIRGVHPDYDREAVRVISMLPAWKGGSHNGRPVSVRMVLPIKFNLAR